MQLDEHPESEIDEKGMSVLHVFHDERRFFFDYDFGDGWEHEVVIEDLTWSLLTVEVRSLYRRPERLPTRRCRRYSGLRGVPRG